MNDKCAEVFIHCLNRDFDYKSIIINGGIIPLNQAIERSRTINRQAFFRHVFTPGNCIQSITITYPCWSFERVRRLKKRKTRRLWRVFAICLFGMYPRKFCENDQGLSFNKLHPGEQGQLFPFNALISFFICSFSFFSSITYRVSSSIFSRSFTLMSPSSTPPSFLTSAAEGIPGRCLF